MPSINVGNIELFYRDDGAGDPVLFVQGLGVDHRGWAGVTRPLSSSFRCVSYDNRDIGRSTFVDRDYAVADLAADAVALLDALGLEATHVVGQSMGGAIAQEVAIRYPERVRKVVLITTYTSGDPRGSAIFETQAMLRRILPRQEYVRATAWTMYSHLDYGRGDGFVETMIQRTAANELWQPQDAYERQMRATVSSHTEDRLNKIGAPTLILAGTEDILTPMRFQTTLRNGIPNSRLELIEGAAHAMIWTHADVVVDHIRQFLTAG